jgi:putative ABC transport system permease protein
MWTLLREVSLRHLRLSPLRTLLVVFGIALGVAMLSAVLATNASLLAAFEDMVERVAGKADLTVAGGTTGVPGDLTGRISEVDGVAHAGATVEVVTRTPEPGSGTLLVLGVDFLGDPYFLPFAQTGEFQVVDDPLAFANDPTAVLVNTRLARERHLTVGSALVLLTPEGEKTFHVRGLLEDDGGPASTFGGQIVVMFLDAAQITFGRGTLVDRIDVALEESADEALVSARIREVVSGKAQVERPRGRTRRLVSSLWVFQNGLNVSGLVALWVGMFLIYNAISVSVAQRRREVGILRALGVTKASATRLFCLEALLMALVGTAVGLAFGQTLARFALENVQSTIHRFILPIHPPVPEINGRIVLIAALASFATTLIGAYFPARKSARIEPVEALRATRASSVVSTPPVRTMSVLGLTIMALATLPAWLGGEVNGYIASTVLLSGVTLVVPLAVVILRKLFGAVAERLLGIPARLALDNVERSLGRSAITAIALMLAVSTSITVATYAGSFQHSLLAWADEAFAADALITAGSPLVDRQHVPFAASMVARLEGVPGLASTNSVRSARVDAFGRHVDVSAMDTAAYFRALERRGQKRTVVAGPEQFAVGALVDAPRVIVSENLAKTHGLAVGDDVAITTPEGERLLEVYAVVVDYSSEQGWMLMDRRYYQAYFGDTQVDSIELFFSEAADRERVLREVRARLGAGDNLFVTLHAALREQLKDVARNVFALARAPELITFLVAIMGVIGTMLAAVIDRLREIGVLRAIGALRGQVVQLLVIEASFLGLSAALCGLTAAVPQGYIFLKVIGVATSGWSLPYLFPLESALRVTSIIVAVSALAGLLPGLQAARLAVRDALSYE